MRRWRGWALSTPPYPSAGAWKGSSRPTAGCWGLCGSSWRTSLWGRRRKEPMPIGHRDPVQEHLGGEEPGSADEGPKLLGDETQQAQEEKPREPNFRQEPRVRARHGRLVSHGPPESQPRHGSLPGGLELLR